MFANSKGEGLALLQNTGIPPWDIKDNYPGSLRKSVEIPKLKSRMTKSFLKTQVIFDNDCRLYHVLARILFISSKRLFFENGLVIKRTWSSGISLTLIRSAE